MELFREQVLRGQASADAPLARSLGHLFLLLCVFGFLVFLGHVYLNSQEQHLGNNAGSKAKRGECRAGPKDQGMQF